MKKPMFALHQAASVFYELAIVEKGRVVKKFPRRKNLVLDQGLNQMATNSVLSLTSNLAVGTGTTETKRDSGATTFSIAGTALSASGNFFVAGDVNRLIKFDTGEEYYISAFTDAQNVTVSGAGGTHGPSEGTIWYVNQTGLIAETQRGNTLTAGAGENSGTWNAGEQAWETKRTILLPVVGAPVTLNEIGWSPTAGAGANLFGRDLIQPGVSLLAGQQLKATITLRYYISPTTPTAWTNPITGGFGTDGDYMFCRLPANNTTTPTFLDNPGVPNATTLTFYISNSAMALPANTVVENNTVNTSQRASITLTSAAYVSGSFVRNYTGSFGSGVANRTDWRSFFLVSGGSSEWREWQILMDSVQVKDSDHRLDITFRVSWGRILVN